MGQLKGKIQTGDELHDFQIPIFRWVEDGIHFFYSPALDLSGYGNTAHEAQQSFEYNLEEFVKYISHKGVAHQELTRLGWKVNKNKKKFAAPESGFFQEQNESYQEIINKPGVTRESRSVALAF